MTAAIANTVQPTGPEKNANRAGINVAPTHVKKPAIAVLIAPNATIATVCQPATIAPKL
jgi:hypothetical protein